MSIFRRVRLAILTPMFIRYRLKPKKGIVMSSFNYPIAVSAPVVRSVAIAALLGATMLGGPLSAARADTATNRTIQLAQAATSPQRHAANAVTEPRTDSVEQRITTLHAALQITPAEDSEWNAVAQAMRDNAAAMDALVAQTRATAPQNMTAVDELRSYQKLAQAHVDGLKNLTASFATLYASMPDAQKKIADEVFESSGRRGALSHSQQG
jgi:periplasmic protein CpxP/Spy